jgi:hypothetical protein
VWLAQYTRERENVTKGGVIEVAFLPVIKDIPHEVRDHPKNVSAFALASGLDLGLLTPALAETMAATATIDSGHGRMAQRRLTASPALVGDGDGPGLGHVCNITRGVLLQQSRKQCHAVVYGVSSLGMDQADAERLLGLLHEHWPIEHKGPWVRPLSRSMRIAPKGAGSRIPQVMAAWLHRQRLEAWGKGDEYGGRLPPFCSATGGWLEP